MIVCHIPEANREKVVPEVTTALQKKYEKMLQNISLLPEYIDIVWIQDPKVIRLFRQTNALTYCFISIGG